MRGLTRLAYLAPVRAPVSGLVPVPVRLPAEAGPVLYLEPVQLAAADQAVCLAWALAEQVFSPLAAAEQVLVCHQEVVLQHP